MIFSIISFSCFQHSCFFFENCVDDSRMKILSFSCLISCFSVALFLVRFWSIIDILLSWNQILIFLSKANMFFLMILMTIVINSLMSILFMMIYFSVMSFFLSFIVSVWILIFSCRISSAFWLLFYLKLFFWMCILFCMNLVNPLGSLQDLTVLVQNHYQMFNIFKIVSDYLSSIYHR